MGEIWDLYDADKNIIEGKFYERGSKTPIPKGMYHLAVWLFMITKDNKIFLTQRAATKSRAFLWEASGGCISSGETSIEGCIRELKEETSINLTSDEIKYFSGLRKASEILEYYYAVVEDIDIDSLILQESEVAKAKLVSMDELKSMDERGELVAGTLQGFEKLFSLLKISDDRN